MTDTDETYDFDPEELDDDADADLDEAYL